MLFTIATIIGADRTGSVAILAATGFAVVMELQVNLGKFASAFEIGNIL